jgi:hypothetical protein
MPKRSSKKPKSESTVPEADPQPAANGEGVEGAVVSVEKNPAAVALGRLGGRKGGPARAKKLTAKQRSEIAKKAAQARWAKKSS